MARGLNKAMLIGRVGHDPDVKQLPGGDTIVNLSIATSESWKDKETGQTKEKTEWHKVTIFRKLAEIAASYVTKGAHLYVEGKIRTREWTDKNGVKRYTTEIHADTMEILSKIEYAERTSSDDTAYAAPAPRATQPDFDDDIPF